MKSKIKQVHKQSCIIQQSKRGSKKNHTTSRLDVSKWQSLTRLEIETNTNFIALLFTGGIFPCIVTNSR